MRRGTSRHILMDLLSLTCITELPLVVAIILRRRQFRHMGIPLLRLLLLQPPPHPRSRLLAVILRIQLPGLYSLRSAHGYHRFLDRLCVRQTNLRRHQGGLR